VLCGVSSFVHGLFTGCIPHNTYVIFLVSVVSHDSDYDIVDEEGEGCHA